VQIVARQISGLGNQFFQYAAARYYAQRYGASLRLAIDRTGTVSHGYQRPNLLSHFCITASIDELTIGDRLWLNSRPLLKPGLDILRTALGTQVFAEDFERRFEFVPALPLKAGVRRLYLLGYWQSFRFADEIDGLLRTELRFRDAARGKNLDVLKKIEDSAHPVSIHVRRGDSVLPAESYVVLSMDYYFRAIRRFQDLYGSPTFFVFSDEIDFARVSLPRDVSTVFVDHNDDFSAHEDLRLMSSCRDHIIANSTFSCWGAWLNPLPAKIVIAPTQWFRGEANQFADSLPRGWEFFDIKEDEAGSILAGREWINDAASARHKNE
jgi:hypothetical protein